MIAFFLRTFFSKKVLQERLRSCTLTKNFWALGKAKNKAQLFNICSNADIDIQYQLMILRYRRREKQNKILNIAIGYKSF